MPFSVWITKSHSFVDLKRSLRRLTFFARLTRKRTLSLSTNDFADIGDIFQSTRRPDDSLWVWHPDDGTPWCAARHHAIPFGEGGHVELSASYANPTFLRNVGDMLDLGLRCAKLWDARVFEDRDGGEVTADNLDRWLDPKGEFARSVGETWLDCRRSLTRQFHAPFEFPLYGLDEASDFFVFRARTDTEMPPLHQLVATPPPGLEAHVFNRGVVLADVDAEQPAVRLFYLDPRILQISPTWSNLPFARVAAATIATVDIVHSALRADLTFLGQPLTPELRAEIETHSRHLGVEFYEWLVDSGLRTV